ncbi:MAG: hypothetical protein AABX49_00300 [Nanoarchaeota archaeon]
MNKRGQELASWEFVKGVVLVVLIVILLGWAYRGIPDSKLNPVKAEDLSLSVSSVFIIDGDLNPVYDLGEEYYVSIDGNKLKLYLTEEGARGISEMSLDKNYNFGEQLNERSEKINIKKSGNSVVVS